MLKISLQRWAVTALFISALLLIRVAMASDIHAGGCEEGSASECRGVADHTAEEAFRLAIAYSVGEGEVADSAKAVQWMRVAAMKGHLYAQFNLGEAYFNGYGIPRNDADGINWLTRAANSGLADAQVSLGLKYDEGVGVVRDPAIAVQWFRAAALQGDQDGQHNLGISYAEGEGVSRDYLQAYLWFERARLAGHPLSGEYRERVARELSVSEVEWADQTIRERAVADRPGLGSGR